MRSGDKLICLKVGVIRQQTRHRDDAEGRTRTLRTKENADDYKYFLGTRSSVAGS